MTRTEIIELASQLTERKGEKVLNLQSLYRFVVQDIAKRQRYWWRRVLAPLTITPPTTKYDLTAIAGFSEIAFDEITKFTIITSPNPLQVVDLTPLFDPEAIILMTANTTAAQPGRYTMAAGDYKTVQIDIPDTTYQAYIVGWGMPNPATDSTNDAVPLIPPWGHNAIVEGMKAQIFAFAYGDGHAKTVRSEKAYEQGILDLQTREKFDPNYRRQMSLQENAVQST